MHILKCTRCNKYTLKGDCPVCGSKTINPKPAKYSPEDPYGRYRRLMKQNAD